MRHYHDLPLWVRLPLYAFVALALAMMVLPLAAALPISLNVDPWFVYPFREFSLRWFEALLSPRWTGAIVNSVLIAVATTLLATGLGTLAAIGLANPRFPFRNLVMVLGLAPLIVPVVVLALGLYIFFGQLSLNYTFIGVVIAHTLLASPFVVITVTATLTRFDFTLMRAAASLGAGRVFAFRTVMLPVIAPGVGAGAILAFAASFDEVVMMLFISGPQQQTVPKLMYLGMRENINPTIIAAAVVTIAFTSVLMAATYRLNRGK
ncbi:ABC transporter permease [Salipiger sp. P9]|uniref:ABC transporter permease n=1 Tax=Salipiger pentaromativorans TaxID=2943193 RepID=UPI00215871F9|nr:ABC transporter permease [Salipiger pentaromativorans]MCR8548144.1 ABC transporter permease [Salipiger pentaromativorans]